MKIVPRVYQETAIKATLKGLRGRQKRALVVLATGLGKTLTVALTAKKFRPKRTLFLVHNNFILEHAIDEFRLVFDQKTNMVTYNGMSKRGVENADIVFATWQTMGKNLKKWKKNYFDLIIVDEAHHTEAKTYRPVVTYFTGPKLGVTATPNRQDDADIRDIFGDEVIEVTLEEAIARGWLPRIEYHVITDESLDEKALQKIVREIREAKKRFTMAEVNRRIFIRKRDEEITRIINGYNEKAVVFCASIVHAERLRKTLNLAATFHSNKGNAKDTWRKNQKTLEDLRDGTVRRVCAVNAFNEGVNVPSVGLVAFCRVTAVPTIFRQQLGRGLRPGKDKLIVLDFVGNLERVQTVLEMMNRISDLHEKFTPQREIAREGYRRQQFEVSGRGFEFTFSDEVVNLMKVLEHCQRDFYPTWQEASEAVKKLAVSTVAEYWSKYKLDPGLPRKPHEVYSDFPGYEFFLTGKKTKTRRIYSTWKEASKAAQKLCIKTCKEYTEKRKQDSKLPAAPDQKYPDFPGWPMFLRGESKDYYPTWQEAAEAAKKLGIRNGSEYSKKGAYKKDSKLPATPNRIYDDFPGFRKFFGSSDSSDYYSTWRRASKAVKSLGITSWSKYRSGRKKDPKLPSNPAVFYSDFPGAEKFFGNQNSLYKDWRQASRVAKRLGIRTGKEYKKGAYKADPKLPSAPDLKYQDFPGWDIFLGRKKKKKK